MTKSLSSRRELFYTLRQQVGACHFEKFRVWLNGNLWRVSLACIQGGLRNCSVFQRQVKDFDRYSKNNKKDFKGLSKTFT